MNTAVSSGNGPSIVYVVDDDESMRKAVAMLLRSVGYQVEIFASATDFLAGQLQDVPSCLILDVRLKGQSGLAVQEQFAASKMQIPIIFMTAHGDIAMSVKAMKAGAMDFLAKPFRDQDMLDAVESALARDAARRELDRTESDLRVRYAELTPREKEVMAYVARGMLNKQIAAELELSEITVKIHRAQGMKKMGARSLADFVLKAEALGIVESATSGGKQ
ncbi:response regulator transcription factor [Cupriavidus agavae]|uniref:LuxR family two component transcriptional regulator n=1 Tax=Cupriavidus agavae TaxID=1001822 RepID=A0A4Q7S085_9BURK|nr:response regulator [Cupriavidus agavae]RZT39503.1 LuxR family two component transcriptional regulator [Cupriavidus agavae]